MNRSGLAFLSFTERGGALADRLAAALGGTSDCTRREPGLTLDGWTAAHFPVNRALIYVGAAGIAVRAVSPYLKSKAGDPAVLSIDERGRFVIPLASGHLGGANDLAREIAALCGAVPVITTATDINGVFAVDDWARRSGCVIPNPKGIKSVSSALLAGRTVKLWSAWTVAGAPPEGVELTDAEAAAAVRLDVRCGPGLAVVPRILTLGVGCRRGTTAETLEARFENFCHVQNLYKEAVRAAATIDLKADEPGLLSFCARHGWELVTFTAAELRAVPGSFTASAFVEARTGVDNVCERAAVLASGGELLTPKDAGDGVTFAAAAGAFKPEW